MEREQPGAEEAPESVTLTPAGTLELALWLHRSGRLQEAESLYRALLEIDPSEPNAMHYLGVIHHQLGNTQAAIALIRASLENAPDSADAWSNLGNVLRSAGDRDGALHAYRKAVELDPTNAAAHNNQGVILKELDRLDEAEVAYRRAIDIDPEHAEAYRNLGHVLKRRGRIAEALDLYAKAVVLRPDSASYRNLSYSLYRAGQADRAVEVIRQWLDQEAGNPIALHLLAAFSGKDVPERAADGFVREVFDSFAETFDAKLKYLEYRAPEHVAEAVARGLGAASASLQILDAGCGTGLCGPLLRPFAARLTGVDLSPGMLAKARGRLVYDELVAAELTEFLRQAPHAFDLVVSADTLVYFGNLDPVVEALGGALRPGGHVVFTLEATRAAVVPEGYRLEPHGRYSHEERYVRGVMERGGFEPAEVVRVVLRLEGGEPVEGLLVSARAPRDREGRTAGRRSTGTGPVAGRSDPGRRARA